MSYLRWVGGESIKEKRSAIRVGMSYLCWVGGEGTKEKRSRPQTRPYLA